MGATTYYEYAIGATTGAAPQLTEYIASQNANWKLNLDAEVTWWWSVLVQGEGIVNVTFTGAEAAAAKIHWESTPLWSWTNASSKSIFRRAVSRIIADAELGDGGDPLTGVSYLINEVENSGTYSSSVPGRKTFNITDGDVIAPIKDGYEFNPVSITFDEAQGLGVHVVFTATLAGRQVELSSPTDEDTGIILQPLLQWGISGDGAHEDDYLFVYLRKDNSNFTDEDDLIGNWVVAELNSSLQVVAGLEYNSTYYWQVQAASIDASLADSEIWSFTTTTFRPPAISTHPISELPTGENNMLTVRRLIAAANGKIWYEDLS